MDFYKPSPNKRVCAFIIDTLIVNILGFILSPAGVSGITWLVWSIYILFKDCFNGKSIGKYLIGIQVMTIEGNLAKPSQTIVRNIFMLIPLFPIVEYYTMKKNKQGRRLGDKFAQTQVEDLWPEVKDIVSVLFTTLLLIIVIALRVILK